MRAEKRVLIVEDDEPIRSLLLTVLGRRGQQIDTATNGAEGIERLRHCHYSLVLLDLMMPVVSGYDFLDELECRRSGPRPLVIVLSADPVARNLNPDVVAGTIRKPFDIELLVDTVEACISALSDLQQPESCPPAESEMTGQACDRDRRDSN